MNERHPILDLIRREAAFIRRRRLARVGFETALAFAVPALLLAGVDSLVTLREGMAMALTGLVAWGALIFLAVRLVAVLTALPDPRDVTMVVERLCPDLMDSLICAVEILESGEGADSPFAAALIHQIEQRLQSSNLRATTQAEAPSAALLAGLAMAAAIGLFLAHNSELGRKARAHFGDRLAGQTTGIAVTPGNSEVAEGDAVRIEARILRGPDTAEIMVRDSSGAHMYRMIPQEDGLHSFEMFGVVEPFTYQISSPTLDSDFYTVSTFPKPAIQRSGLRLQPPPYTELPAEEIDELRDISAPVGSTITVSLTTNLPVTAELVPVKGPTIPAIARRPSQYAASFTLAQSMEYTIRLTDLQGRSVTTDRSYLIEAIEDFAPVITVKKPEDDARRKTDGEVEFEAVVSDDYGVAKIEVVYSLNGGDWLSRPVYTHPGSGTPAQKELTPSWHLELDGLVKNGDILYHYFRATDNAEPEAHVTSTDVRFLEIRPDADEPPEEDNKSENEGEQMEASIADLIREQKALIRDTFAAIRFGENEKRDELLDGLARKAGDLRVSARKRLNDFEEKAAGASLGVVGEMFEDALRFMEIAERRMQGRLPDESMANQQKSLQKLIELEIEMEKNRQKQKGKGKGKPQDQKQQQAKEEDRKREQLEKQEELNAAIDKVEELARRQENLNQDMSRAAAVRDDQQREFLQKQQEKLREETADLGNELRGDPKLNNAASEVGQAADSQRQAAGDMQRGNPSNAARRGDQAAKSLDRSARMLKQIRDAMGGDMLQQAQNQVEQLQQEQQALQGQTAQAAGQGQGGKEQAAGLQKKQEQLREKLKDVMDMLNQATSELDKDNPQAATELAKGIQEANEANVEGNMKRAENALRYKRMDKAAESQQEVADALKKMEQAVQAARTQSSGASPDQLSQMLQQTLQSLDQIEQARREGKGEKIDQAVKDAAEQSKQHAKATGDSQLSDAAQQLDDAAQLGGFGETPALLDGVKELLEQSAARLQQQLALAALRRKLELSRASGQEAPDEYRKLVDEYFRKLSREK